MPTTFHVQFTDAVGKLVGGVEKGAGTSIGWSTTDDSQRTPLVWELETLSYVGVLVPDHDSDSDTDLDYQDWVYVEVDGPYGSIQYQQVHVHEPLEGVSTLPAGTDDFEQSPFLGPLAAWGDLLFTLDPKHASVRLYRVTIDTTDSDSPSSSSSSSSSSSFSSSSSSATYTLLDTQSLWYNASLYSDFDRHVMEYDHDSGYLAILRIGSGDADCMVMMLMVDDIEGVMSPIGSLAPTVGTTESLSDMSIAQGTLVIAAKSGVRVFSTDNGQWQETDTIPVEWGPYYSSAAVAYDGVTLAAGVINDAEVQLYRRDTDGQWVLVQTISSPSTGYSEFGDYVSIDGSTLIIKDEAIDATSRSVPLYVYSDTSGASGTSDTSYTLVTKWVGDKDTYLGSVYPVKDGVFTFTDMGHNKLYVYLVNPAESSLDLVRSATYQVDSKYAMLSGAVAFTGEMVHMIGALDEDMTSPPNGVITVYSGPATPVVHSMSVDPPTAHCKDDTVTFSVSFTDEDGNTIATEVDSNLIFEWAIGKHVYTPDSIVYSEGDVYVVTFTHMGNAADEAMSSTLSVYTKTEAVDPFYLSESGASVPIPFAYSAVDSAVLLGGDSYFADGSAVTLKFGVYDTLGASISDDRTVTLCDLSDPSKTYPLKTNYDGSAFLYSVGNLYSCSLAQYQLTVEATVESDPDSVFTFDVTYFSDAVYMSQTSDSGAVTVGDTPSLTLGLYDKCKTLIPQDMRVTVGWWGLADAITTPATFSGETSTYAVSLYVDPTLASGVAVLEAQPRVSIRKLHPSPVMATVDISLGTLVSIDMAPTSVRAGSGDASFTFTPTNQFGIVMVSDTATLTVHFADQPDARYLAELVPCPDDTDDASCQPVYTVSVGNHMGILDRDLVVSVVSPTTPETTLTVEIAYTIPWFYYATAVLVLAVLGVIGYLYLRGDTYKQQYKKLAFADDEVETLSV
ncbi:hypothetical protein KIPB_002854 [Kipferlia bialata]|uniref:Uncharacterized protein n=1 Tax=Kipferlia bialata TaxID=797122 RepID=A0A9K3CUH4_9EUKA|nr:hypothetical protein KIPB_002854 [Kipferlia bialata]|eukprot:g2854.t1